MPTSLTATASTLRRLADALDKSGVENFTGTLEVNFHGDTDYQLRAAIAQMMSEPVHKVKGDIEWVSSEEPGAVDVTYFVPRPGVPSHA